MGLFSKKENCSICNKEGAKIGIYNGFLCKECYEKASPYLSNTVDISQRRVRELKDALNKYEINNEDRKVFSPNRTISTFIEIDDNNKMFRFLDNFGKKVENGVIYRYGDIVKFDLIENSLTINQGGKGLPKTVKINGQSAKAFVETMKLKVASGNTNKSNAELKIVASELNIRSRLYNSIYGYVLELLQFLESTMDNGEGAEANISKSEVDIVEEIIRIQKLLDEGLITQEEFDTIESRLLGF